MQQVRSILIYGNSNDNISCIVYLIGLKFILNDEHLCSAMEYNRKCIETFINIPNIILFSNSTVEFACIM